MNKKIAVAMLCLSIVAVSVPSMANRYKRGASDNPFRIVTYVVHPVGIALEYVITRPIHWLASQPNFDVAMGHQVPHYPAEKNTYFEWTHTDGTPSIAKEREAKQHRAMKTNGAKKTNGAAPAAKK